MSLRKTQQEIELMREGGLILSEALREALKAVVPGTLLSQVDTIAENTLREHGASPSFKGYKSCDGVPFPSTMCLSVNDEIVHGCANREIYLQEGDIVGMDIGCWYKGLCTDMAVTAPVGRISVERKRLLVTTRATLDAAVVACREGAFIADIARAVENTVKGTGYGIVRSLTGHGVGHAVHEAPSIPNYVSSQFPKIKIKQGMCLAIEPMLTVGHHDVRTDKDGWSIRTKDSSDAAHFEVTLAITEKGTEVLTPQPDLSL